MEVDQLVVRYQSRHSVLAVDRLSFTAEPGSVCALLGPNGAGKSSTIETLEGYRSPSEGRVRVLGLDPVAQHRQLVPRIGVMLQRGGIYPGVRVQEAARVFCAYYANRRQPGELLDLVGLGERAKSTWKQLSGGEQQRLSLALALAGDPEVAFLDEPTASVDVTGRQVVRQVIRDLRERGCCVMLTTHELEEAERLADYVVIVDRGRLVAAGTPSELMRSGSGDRIRFGAPAGLDVAALGAAVGASVVETAPGDYEVQRAATPQAVADVTAWLAEHNLPLADLRAGRESLEDVFLRLTGPGSEPR
ncbi:MAG: transporter [Acidimicrobiia bacterium]|nr:transporter [Acidimicrobiia bacterium]